MVYTMKTILLSLVYASLVMALGVVDSDRNGGYRKDKPRIQGGYENGNLKEVG